MNLYLQFGARQQLVMITYTRQDPLVQNYIT